MRLDRKAARERMKAAQRSQGGTSHGVQSDAEATHTVVFEDMPAALDLLVRCEAMVRRLEWSDRGVCLRCNAIAGLSPGHKDDCDLEDLLKDLNGDNNGPT